MKRTNLLIVFAVILSLIIGFVIGISVDYPRVGENGLSGTIGKVKNYRNTKATEADIELKDELLSDTTLLNSVRNYMTFHYLRAVKLGENIDFAVKEAVATEEFRNQNAGLIAALEDYSKLLSTARKNLLMTTVVCKSAGEASPALLRQSILEANNLIAQIKYGNKTVLGFVNKLDAFIQEKGPGSYPQLNKAHDLLMLNEIGSSLLTRDKALLKFFDKKKLYSRDLKSQGSDIRQTVLRDLETLSLQALDQEKLGIADAEKLGIHDQEKLGFYDQEKLGLLNAEKLDGIGALDAEKLGVFDSEKLAGIEIADSEKLGLFGFLDAEKLGLLVIGDAESLGFLDQEKLGLKDNEELGVVRDAEKLGMGIFDAEKLGVIFDSEKLGGGFWDSEKLGGGFWDSEKLGALLDAEGLGFSGYWQ